MDHTEPRLPEAMAIEPDAQTHLALPNSDSKELFSNLEIPDTPINRLLSQNRTETLPLQMPTFFRPFEEAPTTLESTAAPLIRTLESAKALPQKPGAAFFFFGIGIPASAILLELASGICAETFFDPLPTVWHVLLVCAVPLANLLLWFQLRQEPARYTAWLAAISGLVIGISGFYALIFLPLVPFSLFGLILMGLGILGLSPQLAFASVIKGAVYLRRVERTQSAAQVSGLSFAKCLTGGLLLSLGTLTGLEVRTTWTRLNLQRAASGDPSASLSGIRALRSFGDEEVMLNACYWRPNGVTDLLGSLLSLANPVGRTDAQNVFYRVTGKPYTSLPQPKGSGNGRFGLRDFDGLFDADRGSERIGGVIRGLSLASSRIDGSLDADAALGYFEWTMTFKNGTFQQQEARAQIQLPPGGVVSRLTLWVNGEEREAAFASRGKVQAAYQAVVSARRDPVLVTSSGDDRVLVQCFPVPPSGEMKIRFGVTAPIALETKARGWLQLPGIAERNFSVENLNHAVWFESKRALQSSNKSLLAEHPDHRLFAIRGMLSDAEFNTAHPTIRVERAAGLDDFWTPNPLNKSAEAIHQTIEEKDWPRPQRLVLVVDGSKAMQPHLTAIADSLTQLPEGIELIALSAGDEITDLGGIIERGSPKFYSFVAEKIRRIEAAGGNDNLQALNRAWDLAAQSPGSVILWVHEAKPVLLGNPDELRQRWERRPDNPQLFDLPTTPGANRITEKLDGVEAVQAVPRTGNLAQDLDSLFARWRGESKQVVIFREKVDRKNQELQNDLQETSSHLARLWAFDETRRLLASKDDSKFDKAVKLAASYQLVTPATGAVVLETKEQYERAGLQPVAQNSVPTIPEPEEWLLMIVAVLVLLWIPLRRRFHWQSA